MLVGSLLSVPPPLSLGALPLRSPHALSKSELAKSKDPDILKMTCPAWFPFFSSLDLPYNDTSLLTDHDVR